MRRQLVNTKPKECMCVFVCVSSINLLELGAESLKPLARNCVCEESAASPIRSHLLPKPTAVTALRVVVTFCVLVGRVTLEDEMLDAGSTLLHLNTHRIRRFIPVSRCIHTVCARQ